MATFTSYDDVMQQLGTGKYPPVLFLQGDEPFFIDQVVAYIEQYAIPEADKSFNQSIFYGKDTDCTSVITAAKRYPMMAQKQLVLVKEANELKDIEKPSKVKIGGKEVEVFPLLDYCKQPLESTILVFAYKYKTLDGRKPLLTMLDQKGLVFTSKPLYDDKLPAWISKWCSKKGFSITETAAQMLADNVGNNLSRLHNEIEKVLMNFKEKTTLTDAHIHTYVGISKEYNVFELQNALTRRDVLKCNKIIAYFSENKKSNPIQVVLGSLFTYFSKLILVKYHKPKDDFEASKIVGVPPFIAKEYLLGARNYSDAKLIAVFEYLREADLRSKGVEAGMMDETAIMKELIFKILH